jgi:hypothetical protein
LPLLKTLKSILGLQPKESELISVFLHFRQPMPISTDTIHQAITHAWGRDTREDLNEHVVNKRSIYLIKFDGMMLHLTNGARSYCPPQYLEQALAQFPHEQQKAVAREHKGFLTIDLLSPKKPDASD